MLNARVTFACMFNIIYTKANDKQLFWVIFAKCQGPRPKKQTGQKTI